MVFCVGAPRQPGRPHRPSLKLQASIPSGAGLQAGFGRVGSSRGRPLPSAWGRPLPPASVSVSCSFAIRMLVLLIRTCPDNPRLKLDSLGEDPTPSQVQSRGAGDQDPHI